MLHVFSITKIKYLHCAFQYMKCFTIFYLVISYIILGSEQLIICWNDKLLHSLQILTSSH